MYRRLIIVSIIMFISLCGLCALGLYSISLHRDGLQARRQADFTAVAEQIRLDVKRKLDEFIQNEHKRPYTDYQYYFVPVSANEAEAVMRSPLGDNLHHGLAYGHFQIEPDGTIINPFYQPDRQQQPNPVAEAYIKNIKQNLFAALDINGSAGVSIVTRGIGIKTSQFEKEKDKLIAKNISSSKYEPKDSSAFGISNDFQQELTDAKQKQATKKGSRRTSRKSQSYKIPLTEQQQTAQVIEQSRFNIEQNIDNTAILSRRAHNARQTANQSSTIRPEMMMQGIAGGMMDSSEMQGRDRRQSQIQANMPAQQVEAQQFTQQEQADFDTETVQIRIEPFMTIVTPGDDGQPLFPGQVFLLRHIQIEQKHFLQGFRLDEAELIRQVEDSAWRFKRRDMDFDIGCEENPNAAYTAILDFGFGDLVLNLLEMDPGWITKQIAMLRNGYFAIVAVVFIAVALAQVGLWRTAAAQIKLARKKDDFISAVSHELRTPLTTIRMYTEMLEKNWVKTDEKRSEYYTTMRQESERLTRLIENVLDFSRIQRGRKKYHFKLGDINTCVNDVVDMMTPCAAGAGFIVEKDFAHIDPFTFDPDAVMQIVINLLDNAIKYARNAEDKIIIIRTRPTDGFIFIEVEDHGPGIGHLQRKKVFEEFYRTGSEATRETTGTGLGLALVKKFAQAHHGFVEILGAKPSGAILRVALTTKP